MATSRCPKCENPRFELVQNRNVKDSEYILIFIQCTKCGSVVGVTDYYNIPALLKIIATKLNIDLGI